MDFELCRQPGPDSAAVERVTGSLTRRADGLRLRCVVEGRIGELVIPEPGPAMRRDDLWRTTCFELFLRPAGGESYCELNFSPSGAWAAYDLAAYRAGLVPAALVAAPEIRLARGPERLEIDVAVALALPGPGYAVGIAAVIEEQRGDKSYWALAHPLGPPDFHHPDCFALALPPAEPA